MFTPRRGVILPVFLASMMAALSSSCTVLQAPLSPPVVQREQAFSISAAGIKIDAMPIRTWDANWQLFDDNLPEIGLLAVWIELRNTLSHEVDLGRVRWEMRRGTERFHPVGLDEVFKRYYKRRHVAFYSMNADRESRESMSKWLLSLSRLGPSASQKGFVFFKSNNPQGSDWNHNSILIGRGLPIDAGRRHKLELPLFHANP